jgi:hypothetical protein
VAGVGDVVVVVMVISLLGVFYRVTRTLCPNTYGLEPARRSSFQCRF